MKRLFSRDATMGITKWFHYDEATEEVRIETVQELDPILEKNLKMRNNQMRIDRWGDGKIVASVPMVIYGEWVTSGKVNDQAFLTRWLNDPENLKFRTFKGKV
jgi:hypothetical protein